MEQNNNFERLIRVETRLESLKEEFNNYRESVQSRLDSIDTKLGDISDKLVSQDKILAKWVGIGAAVLFIIQIALPLISKIIAD